MSTLLAQVGTSPPTSLCRTCCARLSQMDGGGAVLASSTLSGGLERCLQSENDPSSPCPLLALSLPLHPGPREAICAAIQAGPVRPALSPAAPSAVK